ncbi:MAG: 50S ribosomal protein L21 [Deltaproteobacteria bacterium]|nr:50S ribosomal protein L21 [Deltaproteobacteria bacterium]
MYAVIQTGGKQYRVTPGEEIKVERLFGKIGDNVIFNKVLLTSDGENIDFGKPFLENTKVMGLITRHDKSRKVIVFKYKRRKGYRKKQGHRQDYTSVKVEKIEIN